MLVHDWPRPHRDDGFRRRWAVREATSNEVKDLRSEASALKETLAELLMENRLLKKSMIGDGEDDI